MFIKEELIKLKKQIKEKEESEKNISLNDNDKNDTIDLNVKVEEFIKWYQENIESNYKSDIEKNHISNEIRNLIEKLAVWYELRYPDYEINRLMPCTGQEGININNVMFKENNYINDLCSENSEIKELDWNEFYNFDVLYKSLPWKQKRYFIGARYKDTISLGNENNKAYLYLDKNGIVENVENISYYTKKLINDEDLLELSLNEVLEIFESKGIKLPKDNELEQTIINANNDNIKRSRILDSIMYRIIERGGNRIGPRRAFLFAKEFNLNIDIPMMYAVDYTDPGLRVFMNEYLKEGGSKDLKCFVGYFSRKDNNEEINTVTIKDLILKQSNNAFTFYTKEEHEAHQRLVNIIKTSAINKEENKIRKRFK